VKVTSIHDCQLTPSSLRSHLAAMPLPSALIVGVDCTAALALAAAGRATGTTSPPPVNVHTPRSSTLACVIVGSHRLDGGFSAVGAVRPRHRAPARTDSGVSRQVIGTTAASRSVLVEVDGVGAGVVNDRIHAAVGMRSGSLTNITPLALSRSASRWQSSVRSDSTGRPGGWRR
jgi:hypothetical protein